MIANHLILRDFLLVMPARRVKITRYSDKSVKSMAVFCLMMKFNLLGNRDL